MKTSTGIHEGYISVLNEIVGARLTSICFILDYLMIGFDEKGTLTCTVWPKIIDNNSTSVFGEDFYSNILCNNIGQRVTEVTLEEKFSLTIALENGTIIYVSLSSDSSRDTERIVFNTPNNDLIAL